MKVKAVEGRLVPFIDGEGRLVRASFVGRERSTIDQKAGKLSPGRVSDDGQEVPENHYYYRAIARGDLILLSDEGAQ